MYGMDTRPKTVAFDFDQTISDHPTFFLSIMESFEKAGFHVIVVTYRLSHVFPEDLDFLVEKGYAVYFTGHKAKRKFMSEKGIQVDIWVDDEPQSIVQNWNPVKGVFYE